MHPMEMQQLKDTISVVADFYDSKKYGYEGCEGYRKSTDLLKLSECIGALKASGFLDAARTIFVDLGCADGRVNVLMSYFVKESIGIEIDEIIIGEYHPRKEELEGLLRKRNLLPPPSNIHLFPGSSLEPKTFEKVYSSTGVRFEDVDLFYTYITLHDVFSERIAERAKSGALYLVYGFSRILPRYDGLELVIPDLASQGIAALYRKP